MSPIISPPTAPPRRPRPSPAPIPPAGPPRPRRRAALPVTIRRAVRRAAVSVRAGVAAVVLVVRERAAAVGRHVTAGGVLVRRRERAAAAAGAPPRDGVRGDRAPALVVDIVRRGVRRRRRRQVGEPVRDVEHAALASADRAGHLVAEVALLLAALGRGGGEVPDGDEHLADVAVAEGALGAEQHVQGEAAARVGGGGRGRDGEAQRRLPHRVPAALAVGVRPVRRQPRVAAGDGRHGVHAHLGEEGHPLQVLGGDQRHLQHLITI
ncbi:hypothetical protein EJB05_33886, partial [Eragrostis curvula]